RHRPRHPRKRTNHEPTNILHHSAIQPSRSIHDLDLSRPCLMHRTLVHADQRHGDHQHQMESNPHTDTDRQQWRKRCSFPQRRIHPTNNRKGRQTIETSLSHSRVGART
ncbi:hypothetical protein AeRB84_009127, partial [Aphanomyces euteiches]